MSRSIWSAAKSWMAGIAIERVGAWSSNWKRESFRKGWTWLRYVLGKNAHRRHMTGEQRAAVVLLATEWMLPHRPAAKGKGDTVSPLSNDAVAADVGVSKRTIQRVKAEIRLGHGEALATGSETLRSLQAKARKARREGAREEVGKADGKRAAREIERGRTAKRGGVPEEGAREEGCPNR